MVSISETYIAGLQEKFNISRRTSVVIGVGLASVVSLLFATQGGLVLLDTVDYFINNYGIALVGLVEVVGIAWFARELKNLQAHADSVSDIMLGSWWKFSLRFITPLILGYMMIQNLRTDMTSDYSGYPREFLFNFGWMVAIGALIFGVFITMKKWPNEK